MHSALNPQTLEKHVIMESNFHRVNSLLSVHREHQDMCVKLIKHHFKLDLLKLLINENVFLFKAHNLPCVSSTENFPASAQALFFILKRDEMEVLGQMERKQRFDRIWRFNV